MGMFSANAASMSAGNGSYSGGDVRAGVSNASRHTNNLGDGYVRVTNLNRPCSASRSRWMPIDYGSSSSMIPAPRNTGADGAVSDPTAKSILSGFYEDSKYTSDKMKP